VFGCGASVNAQGYTLPGVKIRLRFPLGWMLAALALALPARASHPLLTDDTNVLGAGVWEFEVHGERARRDASEGSSKTTELITKLAYGLAETLDVELELPYLRETLDGAVTSGRGDAALAAKWRFYQADGGFSMALKPGVLLPTGRDELGLGAGKTRWGASLLAAYERSSIELIGHVAYVRNRNDIGERVDLWHLSAALRWAMSERLKLVADVARESNPDPMARAFDELVFGLTYAAGPRVDLGIGLKYGLNEPADDRGVRAGVKLRW
jgi:hypothetical protein